MTTKRPADTENTDTTPVTTVPSPMRGATIASTKNTPTVHSATGDDTHAGAADTTTAASSALPSDTARVPDQTIEEPSGPAEPTAAAHPASTRPASAEPAQHTRQPARLGSIIWGLVVIAFAVLATVTLTLPFTIDPTLVVIGLLLGLGALLVIGGIWAALRQRRGPRG